MGPSAFEECMAREKLVPIGGTIIAAVSGGPDSMYLLERLRSLSANSGEAKGFRLAAAHYEHGIRGEDSYRDRDFVSGYCAERGIPCYIGHGNVPAYAEEHGLSVETAARLLRYEFLEGCRKREEREGRSAYIATAHHEDDNAETILMHLLRGCGVQGMRGMRYRTGNIIHPMLDIPKREITEWLDSEGIPYCIDSTNEEADCTRNIMRLRVLPLLQSINPAANKNIARSGRIMSIEDDYIEENALAALKDCAKVVIGSGEIGSGLPKRLICLDRKKLSSCCTAIKRRLVMMAFDEVGAVQDIEYVHVEAVIKLLGCSPGAKTQAPGARVVLNQNNVYFFAGEKELPKEEIRRIEAAEICEGMAVRTGTGVFRLRLIRDEELKKRLIREGSPSEFTGYLDRERLSPIISIRQRAQGDMFRRVNAPGSKSLNDFFIDRKVDGVIRDILPIIFSDEKNAAFIPGCGVSELYKVTESTEAILEIGFYPDVK